MVCWQCDHGLDATHRLPATPIYHATSTHGSDDSQHLPTPELNKADQAGGTMHEFLHLLQAQPGAHLRDKSETEGDP